MYCISTCMLVGLMLGSPVLPDMLHADNKEVFH
jgi:hypothetical protein